MPFLSICFAFALLFSACVAEPTKIPIRIPVQKNKDEFLIGYMYQKPATIPELCEPQKACPTEPGLFTCAVYKGGDCKSFCAGTVTQYVGHLSTCGKSPSALAQYLLRFNCESKCGGAEKEMSKVRVVSKRERRALDFADCNEACVTQVWAQARNRRPQALVSTATSGGNYRTNFTVFAPWLWTQSPCKDIVCGIPPKLCGGLCDEEGGESCWQCALFGTHCTTKCSTCWNFSLDCEIPV